jgi:hypothetical protein
MLAELKQCFMEAYDDNQDGKIDIREVYTDQQRSLRIQGLIGPIISKNRRPRGAFASIVHLLE